MSDQDALWAVTLDGPKHKRVTTAMLGRGVYCPQCGLTGDTHELDDGTQGVLHAPDAFCAVWWLSVDSNPCIELSTN
jgi:hypothetical protein